MAPADAGDYILDKEDDDFFAELNPHPYRGGYDLAATYGSPLPPSADTCYPVSSSSSSSSSAAAALPPPPSPPPEPTDPPPEESYDDGEEAPREPVYESPEVFRNGARRGGKMRSGWRGRGFWRKCVRGLDYLFGYKDPYEERRIGVDSYEVPVYANRKGSEEDALAVEVEVAPPAVGRVEVCDANEEMVRSNGLSWHSDYRDETNTYSQLMYISYCRPSFVQSYGLPSVLDKPDWFQYFSFSESHQVEESQHEASLSYDTEHKIIQPIHHHCYKQPINVQVEPLEPVSSQKLEYYEHFSTYCDQSDIGILETPANTYEIQSYTQISDVPLEPFKPSWSQNWGLYHAYTQGDALANTHPLYGDIGSLFISPFYPQEAENLDQVHRHDEHVSFQQNWHNVDKGNMPMDNVSRITKPADDSYNMNGSLWPFGEHTTYSA